MRLCANKILFYIERKMSTATVTKKTRSFKQFGLLYSPWSKQKGIAPLAIRRAEGVYLYDYDGKKST